MKKFNLIFLIFSLIFLSCNRDNKKIKITDFSKPQKIKVKPYKNYPYTMMNISVKGYANDTILIKLDSKNSLPILKLVGNINERWNTDYYGEGERMLIFEPYKATEGKLQIDFGL
jgi:hypothetical protein